MEYNKTYEEYEKLCLDLDLDKVYTIDELKDFELPNRSLKNYKKYFIPFRNKHGYEYALASKSIQEQLEEFKNSDKDLDKGVLLFFRCYYEKSKTDDDISSLHLEMKIIHVIK